MTKTEGTTIARGVGPPLDSADAARSVSLAIMISCRSFVGSHMLLFIAIQAHNLIEILVNAQIPYRIPVLDVLSLLHTAGVAVIG
jgi:hypothetical protein